MAIKILHPVYGRLPDLVERFRREARAASRIGHPHIVDVTDSGTTDDGSFYFVMEYLEGEELASVIDREGALGVDRSLRVVSQICTALAAAHASGIIHRDLKPENIFLTVREGVSDFVKVLDFGIAKTTEAEAARVKRLTSPGMAMGTPEYMAPEQAAGRPADVRCDVYSVGAILYEMLTGKPPYSGENFMEILTKKATVNPTSPIEIRRSLPADVNQLVLRAMARNPEDRPGSMEAFEYELTKCLSGRGTAVANVLGMVASPRISGSFSRDVGVRKKETQGRSSRSSGDWDDQTMIVTHSRRYTGWYIALGVGICFVFGMWLVVTSAQQAQSPVDAGTKVGTATFVPSVVPVAEVDAGVVSDAAIQTSPPQPGKKAAARREGRGGERTGPPRSDREARKLLREAGVFMGLGSWPRARKLYERVAAGKHRRANAHLGLAKVFIETNDIDNAIVFANKALRAGGGNGARILLGHAYLRSRKYVLALKYYEKVLATNPAHAEALSGVKAARSALRD